ncbi:hypothetical protein FS837_000310 [Tulasnella sp. UAMH 9824]|nr:hypothetical protein FS837_000310 [Tulasnella sp. UAMH 9824]
MISSGSPQDKPKTFVGEDPAPPYTLSTAYIPTQVDPQLPEGWIRQWHEVHQCYFYIDTQVDPPFTTWHHPLDNTHHRQIHAVSSGSNPAQSSPSTSGFSADLDYPDIPGKLKGVEDLQRQVAAYDTGSKSATQISSWGQDHRDVGVLGQREFHPEPTVPLSTNDRTRRSKLPLRTRLMMNTPLSLPFFRREPKWVRRIEKLADRLQRKEDKLNRRMEKWAGKGERRLLQAQHTLARHDHSIPGPSRAQ